MTSLEKISRLWCEAHPTSHRIWPDVLNEIRMFRELESVPEDIIVEAIARSAKPTGILWHTREVLHTTSLTDAERQQLESAKVLAAKVVFCVHAVPKEQCVVCTPGGGEFLYMSDGGTHIHRTPACRSLAIGQEKVRRRGGDVSPIRVYNAYSSELRARDWCKTCSGYRAWLQ